MILYAYTANPDLLPKNVWLQKAPLYEGSAPEWAAGALSIDGQVRWCLPSTNQGHHPFELPHPPCQCALLPPEMKEKWVEDDEMWIDLDHHYAVDIYGHTTAANLRAFLAEHGIKVTLNRLLTILAMDGKEVLTWLAKWNAFAKEYQAKKQAALVQHFTQPHTAAETAKWAASVKSTTWTVPEVGEITPPLINPVKSLYDELMAGNLKVKPKLSPYKWVLSKGVVVRPDASKAAEELPEPTPNVSF